MHNRDELIAAALEFRSAAELVARDTEDVVFQGFPDGCCKLTSLLLARFLYDRGFGKADYVWGIVRTDRVRPTHTAGSR